MLLNEQQISLMEAVYTSIWLASTSDRNIPDMMRLSGVSVAADKVHLDTYIPFCYAATFINNIQTNQKVSFLCASIFNYVAYQIKGFYVSHREVTPEELVYQKTYMEGFSNSLVSVGLRSGYNFANYLQEPCICIRIRGEELFEQTPKTGTGSKIR